MKQFKVLQWAFSFLKQYNREPHVAERLLQHVTNRSRTEFLLHMQDELDSSTIATFKQMIECHAKEGVPIQHMIGLAPFYGRDFYVNSDVLIPRFETEELVERTIQTIHSSFTEVDSPLIVADLGTGSGVIAVTLALEVPSLSVYATDISEQALEVAKQNATMFQAKLQFLHGDFLRPLIERNINPNIIVSNPPYISFAEASELSDTVKRYDPALALFAEKDGLAAYETIVEQITELPPLTGRQVLFEIGYQQGERVVNLIKETFPNSNVDILQDINGKDRIVHANL